MAIYLQIQVPKCSSLSSEISFMIEQLMADESGMKIYTVQLK
jgi:hypothetical protein